MHSKGKLFKLNLACKTSSPTPPSLSRQLDEKIKRQSSNNENINNDVISVDYENVYLKFMFLWCFAHDESEEGGVG